MSRQAGGDALWSISTPQAGDVDEIDEFSARIWGEYHADRGHDSGYSWRDVPVQVVAKNSEGAIIGLAGGDISAGVGHLGELLVDREVRQGGIGSDLLRAFEEHCWAESCHKLTLHTELDGPAKPYYEKRGWRVEAIHRRDMAGLDYVRLVKFRDEVGREEDGRSTEISEG